ncbi:MAG: aminotransferase class V-fold PLP-dependent enzyme [Chloroflexota bacterium]
MSDYPQPPPDFTAVRADFPRAAEKLWLAAAEVHPYTTHHLNAIQRYSTYRTYRTDKQKADFTPAMQQETKENFARLINAVSADEIAFVQSTTDGENIILAGLDIVRKGGNIVIDDLHFEASKYIYTMLAEKEDIELRIVPHRDWQSNVADFEQVIDHETRLVSLALISQINGFMPDIKAISDIAHAHGAYLYCDIIQGAGATPIDVQAMGIDLCACSTYKWLMGEFGLGFLYVRADLQEAVVKQTRYGLRQVKAMTDYDFEQHPGAARYEGTSSMPYLPGVLVHAGLNYLHSLGVNNIRAHVQPLTDYLQETLPALGYQPITPINTPTPIVSFLLSDRAETEAKLNRAFDHQVLSFREWYQTDANGERQKVDGIRIGVSVYNNQEDVERLVAALK